MSTIAELMQQMNSVNGQSKGMLSDLLNTVQQKTHSSNPMFKKIMGYDPSRMVEGMIVGNDAMKIPGGLSDDQGITQGYDPGRLSQGSIGKLLDPQQAGQDYSNEGGQSAVLWNNSNQELPTRQPPQAKLRDLSQIRNLPPNMQSQQNSDNPIDNPRVEVPSGTGMIRNNRTGATYSLNNGSPQANDVALDYSRPIEIFGQGKGYAIKGQPLAAMIDGRRVDYGVDNTATQGFAEVQRKAEMDKANIEYRRAQAKSLGQSLEPPKKPSQFDVASYKFGLKQLERDEKDIEQASAVEQAAKRFQQLNQNVETGRIMGMMPAIGNPERQELEQIQNFLTLNNFKPGQGAISNVEREYMKGAGPSLMNDRQTNDNITQIMVGAAQNARERANFRQMWLDQNRNLSGADAAWQKYIDANPRFLPQKNGAIVENARRVPPEEFFGLASSPQQPAAPPQQPGGHPLDAFRTR
jgi:hypothetical protein